MITSHTYARFPQIEVRIKQNNVLDGKALVCCYAARPAGIGQVQAPAPGDAGSEMAGGRNREEERNPYLV